MTIMIRKLDLSSAENRMDKREIIEESGDKKKIDPRLMESKKIIKAPDRERKKERYLFEECGYLDERTAWRRPPTCKQPFTQWKLGMNETL